MWKLCAAGAAVCSSVALHLLRQGLSLGLRSPTGQRAAGICLRLTPTSTLLQLACKWADVGDSGPHASMTGTSLPEPSP